MHRIRFSIASLAFLLVVLRPVVADCTRESLLAAANSYVLAQTSGKLTGLALSSTNFTYQENNKVVDVKTGVLSQALKIDANRSTADTIACASYTMIISSTGSKPYVLATQIRHAGNDSSTIMLIDTIAATTGSLFFNAPQTLSYIKTENWGPVAASAQANRTELRRVGDAYLDMW